MPFVSMEVIQGISKMSKCYSELILIPTFEGRFEYLSLDGTVGEETFGFNRYLNQKFYQSLEWKRIRDHIIARDNGCEMGLDGWEIQGRIYIHHINPICVKDIELAREVLRDPENLICVSYDLHNAIHYGSKDLLPKDPIIRRPGDTCPWKRG